MIYQTISLFWLIQRMNEGNVSVGDIALILTVNFTFVDYFRKVSKELVEFSEHLGTVLEGFYTVFGENSLEKPPIVQQRYFPLKGAISFQDLYFQYEGFNRLFEKINLDIQVGERVVILGASGSGKSTLISLITRLQEPTEGKIYFDGFDSREISRDALRKSIGVVHQNSAIFSGTIEYNIL